MVIPISMNLKHHPKFLQCISLFNSSFVFDDSRSIWHISSLSEDKLTSIYHKDQKEVCKNLNKYLVRIYPAGIRIDSSNYDPILSFLLGAQIIALNF